MVKVDHEGDCTMSKQKFERTKPHMNIGTIGHVDHGKSTLTAALTKVMAELHGGKCLGINDLDKTPEERARGVTITSAHAGGGAALRHPSGWQDRRRRVVLRIHK
jgi:elongation factor Tu